MPNPLPTIRSLDAAWSRLGAGLSASPARTPLAVEPLLACTARAAPGDHRIFFAVATWLGLHHPLVDLAHLGRLLSSLDGLASATAGALLSVAHECAPASRLAELAEQHCRPLTAPRALFDRIAQNPALADYTRHHSLPLFSRWGLWHDEITWKTDAVRPTAWLLTYCPEMRLRALAGPSLEGRLLEALLGSPGTIPDLACRTDATRAATRAASHRLRTRGLLEADATTPGALRIPPGILAWLRAPLPRQPIAAARVQ